MPDESPAPDLEQAVRRLTEIANSNPPDIDEALGMYSEDAVVDTGPIGAGLFEGRGAIRRFFADWSSSYEDFEQVLEEIRDLGNSVTFALIRMRGRLAGSTASVEFRYAAVSTWTHGLVERVTTYTDIDEARAAAERLAKERG